jgi:pimeloyl-ACP methyl ester carboxylesterase
MRERTVGRVARGPLRHVVALAAVGALFTASAAPATAGTARGTGQAGALSGTTCSSLKGRTFTTGEAAIARLGTAKRMPASATTPAYCDVYGHIDTLTSVGKTTDRINFNLQLPISGWNGNYVQPGNGSFAGAIPTAAGPSPYLGQGAAVGSDDDGHVGKLFDASFGKRPAARVAFAYLAEHLMATTGKAVVQFFYGVGASDAYFIGCSTGGRQGLVEAQRYPADFNGIVAGDPSILMNYGAPVAYNYREQVNRTPGPSHSIIFGKKKLPSVADAVREQCSRAGDMLPGGIIADPRLCPFNVNALVCRPRVRDRGRCLTGAEAEVLQKWYGSPRSSKGEELYPGGEPLGSEGGWPLVTIGTDRDYALTGTFAEQVLRFLAFPNNPGPNYGLYSFDLDTDIPNLSSMAAVYDASDPDLSAFRERGGKLLMYHGFADPLITPYQSIQYYENVVNGIGDGDLSAVQRWFRLFMLPGVYHCYGGPGPSNVNYYGAINRWVKKGAEPKKLVASSSKMRLPTYPYPLDTKYLGGNIKDPKSFGPVVAPRGRQIRVRGLSKPTGQGSFVVNCLEFRLCGTSESASLQR